MLAPLGGMLSPLGVSAVAQQLLLDKVTGAAAAYSLRKLRTAYSGYAVTVRRSSDNSEQDIGFSGSDFDTASFSSFVGAGSGYVKTWYDQSGNARDAAQATTSAQPLIVLSALNGKPVLRWDGTDDALTLSVNVIATDPATVISVVKVNTGKYGGVVTGQTVDGLPKLVINPNSTIEWQVVGAVGKIVVTGAAVTSYALISAKVDSFVGQMWKNGTSQGTTTAVSYFGSASNNWLGTYRTSAANYGAYDEPELIVWNTALSDANRQTAESNINTYYAIY